MSMHLHILKWFLSLMATAVLLTGCGGGGSGSTSISGTVATGAALTGTVDLVDAAGVMKQVAIGTNGSFTIDTKGLLAPFILRATGNGAYAGTVLFSMADGVSGVFNITPLTTLALEVVRQGWPGTPPVDLAGLYLNWNANVDPADLVTMQTAMLEAQAIINANLANQLQANGLTAATYDFLRTAFSPNNAGIDALLDAIKLVVSGSGITMNGNPLQFDFNIDISSFNIGGSNGGGGNGGGGNGGGALTCDTSQFQPNSVHVATSQELASFAGNYAGQMYDINSVASNATAALTSNGNFTLNGQAKTPTSICVDNTAGPYGVVLYVSFAGGHVDLFENDTLSGSIDTSSGGGAGGNSNLVLSVTISGIAGANISINGVPKPSNQTEFCADMTSNSSTSLNNALGAAGTFTINSCSFNGTVGNISATLAITSPVSVTVPYTVVYTYN